MNLIIPERFRPRHWAGWWAAMKTGTTRYDEGQLLAVPALHKDGRSLYVLDFGVVGVEEAGMFSYARSGVLWKVTVR